MDLPVCISGSKEFNARVNPGKPPGRSKPGRSIPLPYIIQTSPPEQSQDFDVPNPDATRDERQSRRRRGRAAEGGGLRAESPSVRLGSGQSGKTPG